MVRANATQLQQIIDEVHLDAMGRPRGGYVYFPPGRYYIGHPATRPEASDQDADIFVPENVTLVFAPGAVLVPMNYANFSMETRTREGRADESHRVLIEIAGAIEAGLHPIFDPYLYTNIDAAGRAVEAGKVIFRGTRVREVYPEWWGAFPNYLTADSGTRNRRAFQAAIDAAHTDRLRALRTSDGSLLGTAEARVWRAEPTIPVVATYNYALSGGLVAGRSTGVVGATEGLDRVNPAAFVLRGRREVGATGQTLVATDRFDEPMLDLDGLSAFYLEGVGFNGNSLARFCARAQPGGEGGVAEFKRCTFLDVRDEPDCALVRVETDGARQGGAQETGKDAAFLLSFTVCRLTPIALNRGSNEDHPPGTLTFSERVSALVLDYNDGCSVELRGCHLQGHCDPMIRAHRGHFTLNETVFHANRRINGPTPPVTPTKPPGYGPFIEAWRAFWNSTNGTDIFLDRPRNAERANGSAPASFTARECESQSFQFLSTWSGTRAAEGAAVSSCVMLNVHHNCVPGGSFTQEATQGGERGSGADPIVMPREQARPSICWEGPGERGCHLVAMGCCFQSHYGNGDWPSGTVELGCIRVAPNQRGAIFHLANTVKGDPEYRRSTEEYGVSPRQFVRTDPGLIPGPEVRVPDLLELGTRDRMDTILIRRR